jgi:hypothetical protein
MIRVEVDGFRFRVSRNPLFSIPEGNPSTPRWPIGSGFRRNPRFPFPQVRRTPSEESVHATLADWFRVSGTPPVFHSRRSEGLLRRKQSTSRWPIGSGFQGTPRFPFPEGIRPRHAGRLVPGFGETPGFHSRRESVHVTRAVWFRVPGLAAIVSHCDFLWFVFCNHKSARQTRAFFWRQK